MDTKTNYKWIKELISCLRRTDRLDSIFNICQQMVSKNSTDVKAYCFAMEILSNIGQSEEGLKLLNQAPTELKYTAKLYNYKGNCHLSLKQTEMAIPCFRHGVSLEPTSINNWLKLVKTHIQQQQIDKAKATLIEALENNPEHPDLLIRLGEFVMNREKNPQLALEYFERAIVQKGKFFIALLRQGSALNKLQRWADAKISLQEAIKIRPNNPISYEQLAISYTHLNRIEEARNAYKKAIKHGQNNAKNALKKLN